MLGSLTRAIVAVAMIALGPLVVQAVDAPPGSPSNKGMLLLRNGEVLEGHITTADGVCVVDLPNGQIRVREKDVEMVCRDLEDGYRRKRAAIQIGNVHHHLELAQWCLHHNLLGPASNELADATVADPKNPMIAVLQRRLKMALEPQSQTPTRSLIAAGPSNDDLDRMVRGLPQRAVETFTQSVQPVLLNACTTSGCHGPQFDGGMRLSRIPSGRPTSRRITQRNLYAALKYVDRDNPAASRLLSAASHPHGTVEHAIFDERQASQYRRLAEWVGQIADQAMSDVPATVTPAIGDFAEPAPRVLPPAARGGQPISGKTPSPQGVTAGGEPSASSPNPLRTPRGNAEPAAKSRVQGNSPARNSPSDPFDPEVFNRKHAGEKK